MNLEITPAYSFDWLLPYTLNGLRIIESRLCFFEYDFNIFSISSLLWPYGDIGCNGWSSEIGSLSHLPYTAAVDVVINLETLFFLQASSKFFVPLTLTSKVSDGLLIDSGTLIFAARCITHSHPL